MAGGGCVLLQCGPRPVSPVCGAQVEPDGELEGHDEGNVDQEL